MHTGGEQRFIEFIQDVLISIHENIHEVKDRKNFADPNELTYIEGKLAAYQETLSILQSSAKTSGISAEEIGL
jgi:hypothetical protein